MRSARTTSPATVVAITAAAAYGVWVTGLEPFSGGATTAVLAAGAVAIGWGQLLAPGAPRAGHPDLPATRAGLAGWAALAAAMTAWQMAAWFQHPRQEHPTISSMLDWVVEPRPIRAAAFVVWLALAAWFARR